MFFGALLVGMAVAGPPAGAEQTVVEHNCTFYKGPRHSSGFDRVTAICHWPELQPDHVNTILSDVSRHAGLFSTVESVRLIGEHNGRQLSRQVHVASGLSDREIVLQHWVSQHGDATRHNWLIHTPQPASTMDLVVPDYDEGYWAVSAHPRGGSKVHFDLVYAPGGLVPKFVVNRFQTSGVVDMVGHFRRYLQNN